MISSAAVALDRLGHPAADLRHRVRALVRSTTEIATAGRAPRLRALREPGWVKKAIRSPSSGTRPGRSAARRSGARSRRGSMLARLEERARWSSGARPCGDAPTPMALPDEIRAACARVAGAPRHARHVRAWPPRPYARDAPRPRSPPAARPRARAPDEARAAFGSSSTRSTSARAGSRRCASRPASRASAPSSAALLARGPWTAAELRRVDAAERAARLRPGPRARADGAVRARAARARRARRRASTAALPRARAQRRRLGRRARRAPRARCRRGATSRPTTASPSRSSSARSSPPPTCTSGPRARRRPRRADVVRRQPRAARAADRRRARVRRRAGRADRPRGADRARLARGGRDPRLRASMRSSCSSPRTARTTADGGRQRALAPRRRAALQGAPAPPGADDRLLNAGSGRQRSPSARRRGARPSRRGTRRRSTSRSGWRARSRAAPRGTSRGPCAARAGRAGRRPRSRPRRSASWRWRAEVDAARDEARVRPRPPAPRPLRAQRPPRRRWRTPRRATARGLVVADQRVPPLVRELVRRRRSPPRGVMISAVCSIAVASVTTICRSGQP